MKLRLKDDFVYDHLTMEWLYEVAKIMRQRFLEVGLSEEQSREIGGTILFDIGMLHDQSDIEGIDENEVSARYIPRISFVDKEGDLLISDQDSGLHEYAFGANDSAYDED